MALVHSGPVATPRRHVKRNGRSLGINSTRMELALIYDIAFAARERTWHRSLVYVLSRMDHIGALNDVMWLHDIMRHNRNDRLCVGVRRLGVIDDVRRVSITATPPTVATPFSRRGRGAKTGDRYKPECR